MVIVDRIAGFLRVFTQPPARDDIDRVGDPNHGSHEDRESLNVGEGTEKAANFFLPRPRLWTQSAGASQAGRVGRGNFTPSPL